MSISFSGLGSGLPIDEWISTLVQAKQDSIDTLESEQSVLQTKSSTLSSLNSTYTSLQTALTKLIDSLNSPSSDIFSKVTVSSTEDGKDKPAVSATVTSLSTPSEFDITVQQLATQTKFTSDQMDGLKKSSTTMAELGITQNGSFSINGKEISFTTDTTVNELIYKIDNSGAGVNAYIKGGTLVLQNSAYGESEINVTADGAVTDDGQTFAQLFGYDDKSNQVLGANAEYTLNGEAKVSSSNNLTSEDTGIVGLNIKLNAVTSEPVTLSIARTYDESSAEAALEEFVNAFNKVITETDTQTASTGYLYGESNLTQIRDNLRMSVTDAVGNGGLYKTLAEIGITTGSVGASVDADTTQLVFDKDKFKEVFQSDPNAVKELLLGNQQAGTTGIMQKLKEKLEPALDSVSGYFSARKDSLNEEISRQAETIEKRYNELELYEAELQQQFNYMDQMIAQLNQQFSYMQSQLSFMFNTSS